MYKAISRRAVTFLISHEVLKSGDREIYEYGFEILISTFVSISSILIISIFAKRIILSTLFLLSFMVSRMFCGGYHAKHHLTCLLTTIANYLIFLISVSLLSPPSIKLAVIITAALSFLLIFLLAPIEHEYNPLSEAEIKRHRRRSRMLIISYCIISFILLWNNIFVKEVFSFGFGIFSVAFSLLMAKIEKAAELNKSKKRRC